MSDDADTLAAAQHLAVDLGWPVMPVRPHGKEPLTRNGVKDATVDERALLHYWERWPDANLAVATGAPGPTVLDIDDVSRARFVLATLQAGHPPEAATARGRHLYFAGTAQGTISLGYGELRGHGSYVVCPPSIHPSGKAYTWLVEPTRALPAVPATVAAQRRSAGAGEREPRARVGHGERHDHLKDLATRLVRSGVTDAPSIERLLRAEYDAVCDQDPPARPDEFASLARWAAGTDIAARERGDDDGAPEPARKTRGAGWPRLPGHGASLVAIREYLTAAAGLPPGWVVESARRRGPHGTGSLSVAVRAPDRMVEIRFDSQREASKPSALRGAFFEATLGAARMGYPSPAKASDYYGMLCALAHVIDVRTVADETRDWLEEYLSHADRVTGHSLADPERRYEALQAMRARQQFERAQAQAFVRRDLMPGQMFAVLVDEQAGEWWIRAGEFVTYVRHVIAPGGSISQSTLDSRLEEIDVERVVLEVDRRHANGQAPRLVLYRIPSVLAAAIPEPLSVPEPFWPNQGVDSP